MSWKTLEGCMEARISDGLIVLRIDKHQDGYLVSAGTWKLERVYKDPKDARAAAKRLARRLLESALSDLNDMTD